MGFTGFFRYFGINYFPITPLLRSTLGKQQCDWKELDEFFRASSGCLLSSLLLPCVYSDQPAKLMHVQSSHLYGEATICPYSSAQKVLQPKPTCPLSQQTHSFPPARRKDSCLPVYALLTCRIGDAEGKERRPQEAKAGTHSSPSPWHLNEPHDLLC